MENEVFRDKMNSALEFEAWQFHNTYKSVHFLAIYWEEGDHRGFKEEAHQLGTVFSNDFHYDVQYYAIPTEQSHVELDIRINKILKEHGQSDHLLIIYYSGHGDPNDEVGDEKLAVWAAHQNGGPTIDWFLIQPKLKGVKAEILLLLDCCYAAQAARAKQARAVPENVELLAACAMGVKTILPGPKSFTTHFITYLKSSLLSCGFAKVSDLALQLASRHSGYRYTPVHFSGLGGGRSTVCLEPFNSAPAYQPSTQQGSSELTLRVSLREFMSENLATDLIQWLRSHPKQKISKLTVDNIASSTEGLRQFIQPQANDVSSGFIFEQFPPAVKKDVLHMWMSCQSLFAALATQLKCKESPKNDGVPEEQREADLRALAKSDINTTLLQIERIVLALRDIVQQNVMALPKMYDDKKVLLDAIEDIAMQNLDFVPLLLRRLRARFPSVEDSLRIDRQNGGAPENHSCFPCLVKEEIENLGTVLVEYKYYVITSSTDSTDQKLRRAERYARTLGDLLHVPGPQDFRTLRCLRWFHQPDKKRFGLVFEYPTGYDDCKSLHDILATIPFSQGPTLAQKFAIVKAIGEATLQWHLSANWVHQGIASYNIYFLKPIDSTQFDYKNPYLCGFEFSRPSGAISLEVTVEDFDTNVYRHPDRHGNPDTPHSKHHDLYSFGILLLEIGMWRQAVKLFDETQKATLTPQKLQNYLRKVARHRLPQHMGMAYERAARTCLNGDFRISLDDPVGTRLAKAFRDLVLQKIEPGTMLD